MCQCNIFITFQGHINHIYTTLVRYKNINKLSELFKSDFVLHVTPSILEIVKQIYDKENEDERNFIKRMVSIPKTRFTLGKFQSHAKHVTEIPRSFKLFKYNNLNNHFNQHYK